MRFAFPHSHAFPHGRVVVGAVEDETGPDCLVEFGDGVTLVGAWRREGEAIELEVPAHRTAKGTAIAARTWRLRQAKDGTWRAEATA